MGNQNLSAGNPVQIEYPDPTKPVIPPAERKHMSKGWILFIGFNILFPIVFLITYLALMR